MIQQSLNKSPIRSSSSTLSFAHFADQAPTAYALYHPNLARLAYYNRAFMELLHCDAYTLEDIFPSIGLGFSDGEAIERWHQHIQRLQHHGSTSLEWEMCSRYGDRRTVKIDLWSLAGSPSGMVGLKAEDISEWKKLARDSKRYSKITQH